VLNARVLKVHAILHVYKTKTQVKIRGLSEAVCRQNRSGVEYVRSWKRLRGQSCNHKKLALCSGGKSYFLDTGLAAFLIDIQNARQMAVHPLKGALFEIMVIAEILKQRFNAGQTDNLYYFRDNIGNEVDLICDHGVEIDAVEIKSGKTISADYFKGLRYLAKLMERYPEFNPDLWRRKKLYKVGYPTARLDGFGKPRCLTSNCDLFKPNSLTDQ
jgi:hypothetical protein